MFKSGFLYVCVLDVCTKFLKFQVLRLFWWWLFSPVVKWCEIVLMVENEIRKLAYLPSIIKWAIGFYNTLFSSGEGRFLATLSFEDYITIYLYLKESWVGLLENYSSQSLNSWERDHTLTSRVQRFCFVFKPYHRGHSYECIK